MESTEKTTREKVYPARCKIDYYCDEYRLGMIRKIYSEWLRNGRYTPQKMDSLGGIGRDQFKAMKKDMEGFLRNLDNVGLKMKIVKAKNFEEMAKLLV